MELSDHALRVAVEEMNLGHGVVVAADSRDGFHGGAALTRWVRTEDGLLGVLSDYQPYADFVRVMPFLEGILRLVFGIKVPDNAAEELRVVHVLYREFPMISKLKKPKPPTKVVTALALAFLMGLAFFVSGVVFLVGGGGRVAIMFIVPGASVVMGVIGTFRGTGRGANLLSAGLVTMTFIAVVVAIFGFIVGKGDFAMMMNVGSIVVAILAIGLAFGLRGTDATRYQMDLRMFKEDLVDELAQETSFDFQLEEEEAKEEFEHQEHVEDRTK